MFDFVPYCVEYLGTAAAVLSAVFAGINFYQNRIRLKIHVSLCDSEGFDRHKLVKVEVRNAGNFNISVQTISFVPDKGENFDGIIYRSSSIGGVVPPFQICGHSSASAYFSNTDTIVECGKSVLITLGDGKTFREKIDIGVDKTRLGD